MASLECLYRSSDLLALNKPWGLSVHNTEDPQNLLMLAKKEFGVSEVFPVHRLDKETSGVQLLALNPKAASKYSQIFENREVKKTYQAILRGRLKDNAGVWKQSLSDKAEGRKNPAGLQKDRVACETRYRLLASNNYFSLCEFDLKTGRQHQIRKHAALNKSAIVGDPRYGDKKYNLKIAAIYKTQRMFLHCTGLVFNQFEIEAQVPEEFQRLFEG